MKKTASKTVEKQFVYKTCFNCRHLQLNTEAMEEIKQHELEQHNRRVKCKQETVERLFKCNKYKYVTKQYDVKKDKDVNVTVKSPFDRLSESTAKASCDDCIVWEQRKLKSGKMADVYTRPDNYTGPEPKKRRRKGNKNHGKTR